jgi:hypothetical protein
MPGISVSEIRIKDASTLTLATELASRKDLAEKLVRKDGLVNPNLWPLRSALGAISCVDVVGGVVALYESMADAMRRHFKTDLNLEIEFPLGPDRPVCMRQYAPQVNGENRKDFCHDPGKHSYAPTHIVRIVGDGSNIRFGEKIGGQEAMGFEWHTAHSCPPESEWGYNMHGTFLVVLEEACHLWIEGVL